jgi:hypothetical protein
MKKAACKGSNPDLFFPSRGVVVNDMAIATCKSCPVYWECMRDGLINTAHAGIYAGLTRRKLARIKKALRPRCPEDLTTGELSIFVRENFPDLLL